MSAQTIPFEAAAGLPKTPQSPSGCGVPSAVGGGADAGRELRHRHRAATTP